jgi:transposase-like protein
MHSSRASGRQRRTRRSREEWRSLVSRFEASGETREAFCAEMGISVSTLRRWCSRFREQARAAVSPAPVFVELPAEEKRAEAPMPPWEVEVQLGDGVLLRLRRV